MLWVIKSAYSAVFVRRVEATTNTEAERQPLNGSQESV